MTQAFSDMLSLLACSAHGVSFEKGKIENIEDVLLRAHEQGVTLIIYPSIKELFGQGYIDKELFSQFRQFIIASVLKNSNRRNIVQSILCKLEVADVEYCILKGEALAVLYHTPETRISSDTDLYVGKTGIKSTLDILKASGFEVDPMYATSHHIIAHHKYAGILEVHHQLYDELMQDAWFDNKVLLSEPYRKVDIGDHMLIPTLGITDGMIFITLHYIKHFLEAGVGIRQMMDMLLYMKHYRSEIDWDRFNSLMNLLKYNKLIAHSIGVGISYLGFSANELPTAEYNPEILLKILDDFEEGGIFGQNDKEREGFYLHYTKVRMSANKSENYTSYIKKWWKPNILPMIFPHPKNLQKKFAYLKLFPTLYPIAWLHRVFTVLINAFIGKRKLGILINPTSSFPNNATLQKRMKLIEDLEMI